MHLYVHTLGLLDDAVVALTRDFEISMWSRGAERIFQVPGGEAVGRPFAGACQLVLPPGSPALQQRPVPWQGELLVRQPGGEEVPVHLTYDAMPAENSSNLGHYILIFKDMRSEVQARLARLQQHAYLLSAIENSADSIFGLSKEFKLLYGNAAFQAAMRNLRGKEFAEGEDVFSPANLKVKNEIRRVWKRVSRGERFTFQTMHKSKVTKKAIYYEVSVNPICSPSREVVGISYNSRDITEQKKAALRVQRMKKRLQDMQLREEHLRTSMLLEGQETERRRLARELHDGLGQMLHVLRMQLARQAPRHEALRTLDEITGEVVRLNNNLAPLVLQDFGLHAGLKHLLDRYQQVTDASLYHFMDMRHERFTPEFEMGVYRIVQEAVSNAIRHARASHISVQLIEQAGTLLIMVEDDGVGFAADPKRCATGSGYGLLNIKSRAGALQGRMVLESEPAAGCVLCVELPVTPSPNPPSST